MLMEYGQKGIYFYPCHAQCPRFRANCAAAAFLTTALSPLPHPASSGRQNSRRLPIIYSPLSSKSNKIPGSSSSSSPTMPVTLNVSTRRPKWSKPILMLLWFLQFISLGIFQMITIFLAYAMIAGNAHRVVHWHLYIPFRPPPLPLHAQPKLTLPQHSNSSSNANSQRHNSVHNHLRGDAVQRRHPETPSAALPHHPDCEVRLLRDLGGYHARFGLRTAREE